MIGGLASSLLLTLLLVPVVYVAIAVDPPRGGDDPEGDVFPRPASGEPTLFDASAR